RSRQKTLTESPLCCCCRISSAHFFSLVVPASIALIHPTIGPAPAHPPEGFMRCLRIFSNAPAAWRVHPDLEKRNQGFRQIVFSFFGPRNRSRQKWKLALCTRKAASTTAVAKKGKRRSVSCTRTEPSPLPEGKTDHAGYRANASKP